MALPIHKPNVEPGLEDEYVLKGIGALAELGSTHYYDNGSINDTTGQFEGSGLDGIQLTEATVAVTITPDPGVYDEPSILVLTVTTTGVDSEVVYALHFLGTFNINNGDILLTSLSDNVNIDSNGNIRIELPAEVLINNEENTITGSLSVYGYGKTSYDRYNITEAVSGTFEVGEVPEGEG